MDSPYLFGDFDVAEFCLIAFFLFFAGLIFYLRREDRREGYPLERRRHRTAGAAGWPVLHGQAQDLRPAPRSRHPHLSQSRQPRSAASRRASQRADGRRHRSSRPAILWSTASGPVPTPSARAIPTRRSRVTPRSCRCGSPLISTSAPGDPDPRGMTMIGCDGKAAGIVSDVWVDRSEVLIRYLEVAVGGEAGRKVVLPMTMVVVSGSKRTVSTHTVTPPSSPMLRPWKAPTRSPSTKKIASWAISAAASCTPPVTVRSHGYERTRPQRTRRRTRPRPARPSSGGRTHPVAGVARLAHPGPHGDESPLGRALLRRA